LPSTAAAAAALQVPLKVLNSYRIVKVEAPEAGVTMFVVRSRKSSSTQPPQQQQQQLPQGTGSSSSSSEDGQQAAVQLPGTEAEAAATIKSCRVSAAWRSSSRRTTDVPPCVSFLVACKQ
jgi:hypothetical protein